MRSTLSNRGKTIRTEYDSIEDLAKDAEQYVSQRYADGMRQDLSSSGEGGSRFYGDCKTPGQAFVMAREGWTAKLAETLEIAREAVETIEAETEQTTFQPHWDVSGGMIDMGAFLANEPECMIEFPPAKISRVGRVITLCASISHSAAVSAKQLVKRGQIITALALELSRMGMNVELYADFSACSDRWGGATTVRHQAIVLVKGANDTLDPAKILFAYAHPATLRVLSLTAMHGLPREFRGPLSVGGSYGSPDKPAEILPAGTIYLPEVYTGEDVDAAATLRKYMQDLGLADKPADTEEGIY